jgi:hypothetical protein
MSYKIIILTLSLFFILGISMAQNPFPTPPPPPKSTPIDGGLSILLASGAVFGAKKLHDFRKK